MWERWTGHRVCLTDVCQGRREPNESLRRGGRGPEVSASDARRFSAYLQNLRTFVLCRLALCITELVDNQTITGST